MRFHSTVLDLREIPVLLRGELEPVRRWIRGWDARRIRLCVAVILMGAGLYGFAMGWWRSPLQAFFSATKLPLVILLTTFGNALLNGMLAPLLGLNIGFRQSLFLVLMSFTIAAAIWARSVHRFSSLSGIRLRRLRPRAFPQQPIVLCN